MLSLDDAAQERELSVSVDQDRPGKFVDFTRDGTTLLDLDIRETGYSARWPHTASLETFLGGVEAVTDTDLTDQSARTFFQTTQPAVTG